MSFTRSAVGALAQLLAVGWVVSVALTLTSGSALANLPAAVLGVYALRVLAQVRLDARWDATTRRLSLSVTRVAPGDPADPSAGSFVAPANGAREGSAAKRAPVPGAASPHPSRDVPSSSPAPPPLHPADREAELRDLLRRFDPPPRDADPSAHGVLGAWSRLRDHIVRDFVLHLWYRSLTRDESFPNDVARLLDAAFVELAHRARRADLHRLFLRVVPDILATQLEHFRDARDACGGVDAYVRLTPTAADRAIATQLRKRGRLHPGVEYANTDMGPDASVADVVALGAARDPAAARLSRACGIAAAALLHVDATTSFAEDATATSMMGIDIGSVAVVSLTREVLATCALRPLLGFASPTWIHRGLAALFAAEDDIAAAEAEAKEETEAKEEEETSPVSKEETSPVSSKRHRCRKRKRHRWRKRKRHRCRKRKRHRCRPRFLPRRPRPRVPRESRRTASGPSGATLAPPSLRVVFAHGWWRYTSRVRVRARTRCTRFACLGRVPPTGPRNGWCLVVSETSRRCTGGWWTPATPRTSSRSSRKNATCCTP